MPNNPFHINGPINPKKFIGRRSLAKEICHNLCLRNGQNSYGIVGGHLFGRSSLLHFLEESLISNLKQATYGDLHILPVYVGLNGAQTFTKASDVLGFILHSLRMVTCRSMHTIPLLASPFLELGLPEYTQISSSSADLQELEAFIAQLIKAAYNRFGELRILLLIDDADRMLNFSGTSTIFGNLRALIYDGDVRSGVRLVLAGSRSYIDEGVNGSPLNNSITRCFLEPFTELEAHKLTRRARGIKPEVADEVILQSGGHPFILQHMLYYLFQNDIKLATLESVHGEVEHFVHNNNGALQGWRIKIGEHGRNVYSILSEMDGWAKTENIRQKVSDTNLQVDIGLNSLHSHGFVVRNEIYQYRICGQLFKGWFESHCQITQQELKQPINVITSRDTMSNISNQRLPTLPISTVQELATIIAKQAADAGSDPKIFFKMLIESVDMPELWRLQIIDVWAADVIYNALRLIKWAASKGVNPEAPNPQFTLLGNILNELLKYVGRDDARITAAVIANYQLCLDEDKRKAISVLYQVPQIIQCTKEDCGDSGVWLGPKPENNVKLQSLLKSDPALQEIEFLKRLVKQADAICCIELPQVNRQGTGFLITDDLILTSYHLLKWFDDEDINANAQNVELRFGYTTRDGGQIFNLTDNPIIQSSPANELDYALLRVNNSIVNAQGIKPVSYNPETPHLGTAMHILQHPEGDTMKVAISSNGVTSINQERGLIHYVTRTRGGSSGSPCFNENWQVVALHHAELARPFGSVGQGILFSLIYKQIKKFLLK